MDSRDLNLPAPFTPWPEPARHRRKLVNAQGQEKQHRLLRADAVSLTITEVARMSEGKAFEAFCRIRFYENGGAPYCPHCESRVKVYPIRTRRIFKCGACGKQFSATSGTAFASRKMSIQDILIAALVFVNGVNGTAALRLTREIGCSYKSAFVLGHKLRQAMGVSRANRPLSGEVEVDGAYFNRYLRAPTLFKWKTTDGRKRSSKTGTQAVVAARERGQFGESRVIVVEGDEANGKPFLKSILSSEAHLITDNGPWDSLGFGVKGHDTVDHNKGYKIDEIDTNQVESLFARLRRAEGVYTHIRGRNLDLYAHEVSWREDHRHFSNGDLWFRALHAMTHAPVSGRWKGYWQRWSLESATPRNRRRTIGLRVGYGLGPRAGTVRVETTALAALGGARPLQSAHTGASD